MSTYTQTPTTDGQELISFSAEEGAMLNLQADNSINAKVIKRISDKLLAAKEECNDDIIKINRARQHYVEGETEELDSLLKIHTLKLQSFNYWLMFCKTCNFDERFNKKDFIKMSHLILDKVKGINQESFALWEEAVEKEWINEQLYLQKSREACDLLKIVEDVIITVDEGVEICWDGVKGYVLNPVITDSNGRTYSIGKK